MVPNSVQLFWVLLCFSKEAKVIDQQIVTAIFLSKYYCILKILLYCFQTLFCYFIKMPNFNDFYSTCLSHQNQSR